MYSGRMLALDCGLEFDLTREEEFFAAVPARPAVFLIEPRTTGANPYLGRTRDLRRRLERLLRAAEVPSKRLNLREFAAGVRYRLTGSSFEQSVASEYPRCYVTRRVIVDDSTGLIADGGFYFGPFPTRKAAEAFSNDFLNLFKIRRCQIKIRRDPSFPGCIYSEMKMCLAPCFAGCSKAEYDVEVGRVVGFLASSGAVLTGQFEREREAASALLDFERAAALHRKLEKVAEVLGGLPELARKVDELDAVILQPAAEESAIAIFAVRGGRIADPFFLRFGELASRPRSVEEILREHLVGSAQSDKQVRSGPECGARFSESGSRRDVLAEHLALLARWFYSKPRQGEIFFRQHDWPYRRMIRACSRLLASPTSAPRAAEQGPSAGS